MQRRKFLATVGSLTAGSAAAIGTGAFTTRAARDFKIDVVGDSSAYLGITAASGSNHVSSNGGTVSIDLGSDSGHGGSGINQQGETLLRPAFYLGNQGEDDVFIEIDNPLANNDITTPTTNSSLANGGMDVHVPAGLDVQFLAATSIPPGTIALIGRDTGPESSNGGNMDNLGSNEFYYPNNADPETNAGARIDLSPDSTHDKFAGSGAIKLGTGEQVPVILRVVVTDVDNPVPEVDFTVEAYSDSGALSYNQVGLLSGET